jgi:hypothetical protein
MTVHIVRQRIAGSGAPLRLAWGQLSSVDGSGSGSSSLSNRDDQLLQVTLYQSAKPLDFILNVCGPCDEGSGSDGSSSGSGSVDCDNDFLDMDFELCTELETVLALVPAGYKAGPVGLAKWPVCAGSAGSGSLVTEWDGWVVLFGKRERCVGEIPSAVTCCPIEGLKFTAFNRFWYFGGPLPERLDPCVAGSGSGS